MYHVLQHPPRHPSPLSTYLDLSRRYSASSCNPSIRCGSIPSGCSSSVDLLWQARESDTFCSSSNPHPSPPTLTPQLDKQPAVLSSTIAATRMSGIRLLRTQQSLGNAAPSAHRLSRSLHASSLQADSVLRKRRTKMKRHKWKKRSRLMRRKSKVSQGAKR